MRTLSSTTRFTALLNVVAASLLACPTGSHAQSYRCRSELISVGDAKEAVRRKCGEPAVRETVCEAGSLVNGIAACVNVARWTYRPGYGQFVTILRFDEDGVLAAISDGDRQ